MALSPPRPTRTRREFSATKGARTLFGDRHGYRILQGKNHKWKRIPNSMVNVFETSPDESLRQGAERSLMESVETRVSTLDDVVREVLGNDDLAVKTVSLPVRRAGRQRGWLTCVAEYHANQILLRVRLTMEASGEDQGMQDEGTQDETNEEKLLSSLVILHAEEVFRDELVELLRRHRLWIAS